MKIGVFDSGKGGEAVADELKKLLPDAEVRFVNDRAHVPYGGRSKEEIFSLTNKAIQPLLALNCDAIVIACNTATTNAIERLRATYPNQKFIGLEPMVKPAASLTKTGVVAVLATPATLASRRYKELRKKWAHHVRVIEPDCTDWASQIEDGEADTMDIETTILPLLAQHVDVIVLACTHYHHIKSRIQTLTGPSVTLLEPTQAVKNRLIDITG